MTHMMPSWWNDSDQLYTVLRDLLRHLRARASTFDERAEGWLYMSGATLDMGPWRYVKEVDVVGELPFETGLVLVNQMLQRLHNLDMEREARETIGHVRDHLDAIFSPVELQWFGPEDPPLDN